MPIAGQSPQSIIQPTKPRPTRGRKENVGALVYQSDIVNGVLSDEDIEEAKVYGLKAERSLYYEYGISSDMLTALVIVSRFLKVTMLDGATTDRIVGFSGSARGWKAKMYAAIRSNIKIEVFEQVPKGAKGFNIRITPKGRRVLENYRNKINEIRNTLKNPANHSQRWASHAAQVA